MQLRYGFNVNKQLKLLFNVECPLMTDLFFRLFQFVRNPTPKVTMKLKHYWLAILKSATWSANELFPTLYSSSLVSSLLIVSFMHFGVIGLA